MSLLSKYKYHSVQGGAVSRPHPNRWLNKSPSPQQTENNKRKTTSTRECAFLPLKL